MSPQVAVLGLGGTIAMAHDASGGRAMPGAGAPGAALGGRVDGIRIIDREIADLPSPSLGPAQLGAALTAAREAVAAGAAGVVLTHGTDTLEESAFLLNRLWDLPEPLVLTGAMLPATDPTADGPGNLRDAVRTAASPAARERGVLAVLEGRIHAADRVRKSVSQGVVGAFTSEGEGPLGTVDGTGSGPGPRFTAAGPVRPLVLGGPLPSVLPRVPLLALGLGDAAELLDAVPAGSIAGLVVAGVGVGHVAAAAVPRLERLMAAGVPVLVATRVAAGGTARDAYGYPGSEADLLARGCLLGGRLRPSFARLLLQLLLARGAGVAQLREATEAFGA